MFQGLYALLQDNQNSIRPDVPWTPPVLKWMNHER